MSATTRWAFARADDPRQAAQERPDPDDLSRWFATLQPKHDVEVEHGLAQLEAALFNRTRPVTLARHVLLARLGAGANGVVYEAYDPHLDRKVAIKVLKHSTSAARYTRMLAEARALARLVHPNVVGVHDVAIEAEGPTPGVYIVMELVAGTTLEEWLATPRRWRDVLNHLIGAGRGLHAAHVAGLVHRDFKPANVLIGDDGRVKVTDFGLAIALGSDAAPSEAGGTPLYMAPELRDPEAAGPASDQYAFCVAAWEALTGSPPNTPGTASAGSVTHRHRPRPPRALLRALRRGLHTDPTRRWPTMGALLQRLGAVRRRRLRVVAGVAFAVALAGFTAASLRESGPAICLRTLGTDTAVWTAADRERVAAAWGDRAPFERDALARALDRLDAQADAWRTSAARVCQQAGAGQPAQSQLSAMACVQRHRDALAAAAEVLGSPECSDPIRIVAGLSTPLACLTPDDASRRSTPPPGIGADVAAHRTSLARADALRLAGHKSAARELAQQVLSGATRVQFRRLELEARLELGLLSSDLEGILTGLAYEAIAVGHDDLACAALLSVGTATSDRSGRADEALALIDLAEALAKRSGLEERIRDEIVHRRVGVLHLAQRHHEVAALFAEVGGSVPPHEYLVHAAAAAALMQLGRRQEAQRAAQTALSRVRSTYGASHVLALEVQITLASTVREDDPALAKRLLRDVRRRLARDVGRDNQAWLAATNGLALSVQRSGGYAEAAPLWQELLGAVEDQHGVGSLKQALVLNNIAAGLTTDGRGQEAIAVARRALQIRERMLPAGHYHRAASLDSLGAALVSVGDYEEGDAMLEQAVEIWGAASPLLHRVADPMTTLGRSRLQQGRARDALRWLDRALAIVETANTRGWPRNEIHLARARALEELGRHDEARRSASRADLDDDRGVRPPAGRIDTLVTWLRRAEVLQ